MSSRLMVSMAVLTHICTAPVPPLVIFLDAKVVTRLENAGLVKINRKLRRGAQVARPTAKGHKFRDTFSNISS